MATTEDKLINLGRLKHYHEKLKTAVPFLDSESKKIPSTYLPSYVDDVLEFTNLASFPTTGETGKIYVDTSTNKTYRWSGTTYVEISASLALGKVSGTAYPGNDGATLEQDLGTLEHTVSGVQSAISDINNTITSIKDYEFLYVKNTTKPVFNTAATSGSINFPTVEFNGPSVDSVQVTIPTFTNSTAGLVAAPQHTDGEDVELLTYNGWRGLEFDFDGSTRILKLYAGDINNTVALNFFPISSASEFGFIRTGYTATGKNYAVKVNSSGDAYVNVPWTDTNTTYNVVTQSANGLMSAADKTKLDGISAGAEVNQNAFSNVVVGSITIAADSKTDSLTLAAGSNVTITPDATNDKITIAATNTDTKVTQNVLSSNTGYYPLIGANTAIGDSSSAPTTETNGVNKVSNLKYSADNNSLIIKGSDGFSELSPTELVVGEGGNYVSIQNGGIMSKIGSSTKVFASNGTLMEIEIVTDAEIDALFA